MWKIFHHPLNHVTFKKQVNYTINPWMDQKQPVDREKAMKQWETLKRTVEDAGAKVEVMDPKGADHYPDLVFTANAGLVRARKIYISHFFYPERKGEEYFYKQWFESNGYETISDPEVPFEGSGDALWAGKNRSVLYCGVGPRTDVRALALIASRLADAEAPFKVIGVRLVDPRFYHIDTCFCPLNDHLAIHYPGAFDPIGRHNLSNDLELLPVDEIDATRFACNSIVVGKNVIMQEGSERTARLLEKLGFNTLFVDMSEFIKAGGSAKCCSLEIGK
jgi:N-dimethylarginine dimethylaminohydrolase